MKTITLAVGLALASSGGAFAADPVLGTWKTQVDDGAFAHVDMYQCGPAICGKIVRTFNDAGEYKSENLGKDIVRSMTPSGENAYAGKVWRPSNNKVYKGKIALNGNSLKLAGCVAGGLLCSKQTWQRIK